MSFENPDQAAQLKVIPKSNGTKKSLTKETVDNKVSVHEMEVKIDDETRPLFLVSMHIPSDNIDKILRKTNLHGPMAICLVLSASESKIDPLVEYVHSELMKKCEYSIIHL